MNLDNCHRAHLEWMFENQPDNVRQLHQMSQLGGHLQEKQQQALRRVEQLQKEAGMSYDAAFECALGEVLAPADGPAVTQDPAPNPLSVREQAEVWSSLEHQPEP